MPMSRSRKTTTIDALYAEWAEGQPSELAPGPIKLEKELFMRTGITATDPVVALEEDEELRGEGWEIACLGSWDDPIMAIYRDGVPMAGCYFSFRGAYQGGGVLFHVLKDGQVQPSDEEFFATDFFPDMEHDVWVPRRGSICASVVREMVLGEDHSRPAD